MDIQNVERKIRQLYAKTGETKNRTPLLSECSALFGGR